MMTVSTAENEVAEVETETTTKRRGRVAKPALTLTDALSKFDSGEMKAFSAEYGDNKLKSIFVNIEGVPTVLAPGKDGENFVMQDYATMKNTLSIIDSVYKVSVKSI